MHDGAERDDRRHPNEATQGGAASTQAREVGVRVEQCLVGAVECAPIAPPLTLSHPVGHGRRCTRGCALEPRPRRAEVCARCASRRRRVRDDVTNQTAEARQHGRTREGGAAKVFGGRRGPPPTCAPAPRREWRAVGWRAVGGAADAEPQADGGDGERRGACDLRTL